MPKGWACAVRAARKEEQALFEQGEHSGEFRWQRCGPEAAPDPALLHHLPRSSSPGLCGVLDKARS